LDSYANRRASSPQLPRLSYDAASPPVIVGVDGRSQEARQFRGIVDALASEYCCEIDPLMLREPAGLRLSQQVTATAIIGERASDIVQITNLIASWERDLREAKRATPDKPVPLSAYLGRNGVTS